MSERAQATTSIAEVIESFSRQAVEIPGVTIWVTTEGDVVHFISLIPDDDAIERALYLIEQQVLNQFDPDGISFEVHRTGHLNALSHRAIQVLPRSS